MTQEFKQDGQTRNQELYRMGATSAPSPKPSEVQQPKAMQRANRFVNGWLKKNEGALDTVRSLYQMPQGEMTIPIAAPGAPGAMPGAAPGAPAVLPLDLTPGAVLETYRQLANDPVFLQKLDQKTASRLQELERLMG